MAEILLALIKDWGIGGVLLSLFIEGSAFPFIGTFLIVTVGFIMDLNLFELGWISLLGSFVYALGSYIPYYIGHKFGKSIENRLTPAKKENVAKVKASFNKHGVWSVAILSPLHLGNVVPLLAGMSNMNLRLYTLLTMLGIAPTTFLFFSIGSFYDGETETIIKMITDYQSLMLLAFGFISIIYIGSKVYNHCRKRGNLEEY